MELKYIYVGIKNEIHAYEKPSNGLCKCILEKNTFSELGIVVKLLYLKKIIYLKKPIANIIINCDKLKAIPL